MSSVHTKQESCEGCPFGGPRVGSKGDPESPLVIVAESPGIKELREGVPLAGPTGKIFHSFVEDGSAYILNAMECFPGQRKGEEKLGVAVKCCQGHLIEKIKAHPRKLIVAMGNPAVRSVMGNSELKITQVRGRLMPSPLAALGVLPVVHLAALMRGTGSFRQWKDDIKYALELIGDTSTKKYKRTTYEVVPLDASQADIDAVMDALLLLSGNLSCDVETSSLSYTAGDILNFGISNGVEPLHTYMFDPSHIPLLKRFFENPNIKWCWHNGKFDVKFFQHNWGVEAKVDDDTMLMSYALDEAAGVHGLEGLSSDKLGAPDYKDMVQQYLPNKKASYSLIPRPVLDDYCSLDVGHTAQLRDILREEVRQQPDLDKLYTKVLIPASATLTQVERNGFCVDPQRLDENDIFFRDMLEDQATIINEIVGHSINAGSPKQVAEVMFKQLGFPDKKKGSTDAGVIGALQDITGGHPFLSALLEHRKAVKMRGTYVKGIRRWVHDDGRVHPTFKIHGTRTGRLSASEPNTQNPPRIAQIRGTFVAAEGYELIECDLSQAELRSLAALSKDPALMAVFINGEDPHSDLAIFLFPGWLLRSRSKDPVEKALAKEQRVKCKNVNFGIIYGITIYGLQVQLGGPLDEARDMLSGWARRYPTAWAFIEKCRQAPASNQIITTTFGRKKRVGLVSRGNIGFLMNEAANFPHQSIASDITLCTANECWEELLRRNVKIVNLVHDSIIMESPITSDNGVRRWAMEYVCDMMMEMPRRWGITEVPFASDPEVGLRWGSLEEYKL